MEQALDELARIAGFDPLELRRKNAVGRGDMLPTGVILTGAVGIGEPEIEKINAALPEKEKPTDPNFKSPKQKKTGAKSLTP